MATQISPRVSRRPSKRRNRAISSLPQPQSPEVHNNALQAIRTFLKGRSSYDVFPVSFRLIVLDNKLEVKKALAALVANGALYISLRCLIDLRLSVLRCRLCTTLGCGELMFRWDVYRLGYHTSYTILLRHVQLQRSCR